MSWESSGPRIALMIPESSFEVFCGIAASPACCSVCEFAAAHSKSCFVLLSMKEFVDEGSAAKVDLYLFS